MLDRAVYSLFLTLLYAERTEEEQEIPIYRIFPEENI